MNNEGLPANVGSMAGLGLVAQLHACADDDNDCLPQITVRAVVMRAAAAEIELLSIALRTANERAERFERGWYLRGDALKSIKAHCTPQQSVLASGIVATCEHSLKD